jgi:hypothetical protein
LTEHHLDKRQKSVYTFDKYKQIVRLFQGFSGFLYTERMSDTENTVSTCLAT